MSSSRRRIRSSRRAPVTQAGCGGCTWQHVDDDAQLDLKSAVVLEALKRTGKLIDPVVELGSSVPAWAYRTTLRARRRAWRSARASGA